MNEHIITKELLAVLACPVCHGDLQEIPGPPPELRCTDCRRIYPVRDGIPVMLPEEARIENG
ncbi:MAG: Trm112 family protein [Acidobacteriota bacterium]|jgi:uncharacterized protein YbaR (Trm112 family)|nr:Trm112 family protein [Acidobacteriota bacterium]